MIAVLQKLRLSPTKASLLPVCLTHPVAPMVWAFLAVKVRVILLNLYILLCFYWFRTVLA